MSRDDMINFVRQEIKNQRKEEIQNYLDFIKRFDK